MYEFIEYTLHTLDSSKENPANFPIAFLVQLSKYLGFYPQGEYSDTTNYFDLQEGQFISMTPNHPYYLEAELAVFLNEFLKSDFKNYSSITIDNNNRRKLLDVLIEFYKLHIHSFGEIKSHKVLEEIIN